MDARGGWCHLVQAGAALWGLPAAWGGAHLARATNPHILGNDLAALIGDARVRQVVAGDAVVQEGADAALGACGGGDPRAGRGVGRRGRARWNTGTRSRGMQQARSPARGRRAGRTEERGSGRHCVEGCRAPERARLQAGASVRDNTGARVPQPPQHQATAMQRRSNCVLPRGASVHRRAPGRDGTLAALTSIDLGRQGR